MKKLPQLFVICCALALFGGGATCRQSRLEPGGAYATTNTVPDLQFYQVEATFALAYATIDTAFKFEKDNRQTLWALSPDIKHGIDKIRPDATAYRNLYIAARKAYLANPVPTGLSNLQSTLLKIQQIAVAAQTAIGNIETDKSKVK